MKRFIERILWIPLLMMLVIVPASIIFAGCDVDRITNVTVQDSTTVVINEICDDVIDTFFVFGDTLFVTEVDTLAIFEFFCERRQGESNNWLCTFPPE